MAQEAGLQPLTTLPGVGPALRDCLERLGAKTLQDLWFHLPLRYEDRTRLVPIADLRPLITGRGGPTSPPTAPVRPANAPAFFPKRERDAL